MNFAIRTEQLNLLIIVSFQETGRAQLVQRLGITWPIRGSNLGKVKKVSLLLIVKTGSKAHAALWVKGASPRGGLSSRSLKYTPPPPSAEVQNVWSYTFASPVRLYGTERGSFNFLLLSDRRQVE